MTEQRLDQYKGKLTAAQIASGMNAASENAHRLAADARLLVDAGRFPTAASLAVLSIEESGKVSILRALALARNDEELRESWKEYRSHTAKNLAWVLPDLVQQGARSLEDLRPIFDPSSDHPQVLDHVKQLGFYTDCLRNAHWSVPDAVIDKDLAVSLVTIAEMFARKRRVTPEEITLWARHIGPVWKGPMAWMETALIEWHRAMKEAGLEVKGDMERFVRGTEQSGDQRQ